MSVVLRYEITKVGNFSLELPVGSKILSAGAKFERPMVWILRPTITPSQEAPATYLQKFVMAETGVNYVDLENYEFIDTIHLHSDTEIYHLFAKI